ncbi:BOS complex subunit NOMO1-like [Clavelina lepadiformis]|uniref:BOS complex subunit NOMO1-like n=1 Tax=Clavelina lepadiformis TaxID=159417 RepID=UPI004043863A
MVNLNLYAVCWFLLSIVEVVFCQEILGCGGFVKSDVSIDFTQIEIQLFTYEGMLKYQTECAPNNGYFMVPFVEKGNFILKIDPPKGWLFEPMSVDLSVDGVNDDCTKGKDINFVFKGFAVSGQVSSIGTGNSGPEGVIVKLKASDSNKVIDSTETIISGTFHFDGVPPGQYVITASHETFLFSKQSTTITVTNGNAKCKEDLVVSGYDIRGKVSVQSLPVTGVELLLFTKSKLSKEITDCNKQKPASASHIICQGYPVFLCTATSGGEYSFPNLPPADYAIIPYHKGERMQFEIEPNILKVSVKNNHIVKGTDFTVTGYSVQGRILHVVGGKPVEGAMIMINGKQQDVTNSEGYYTVRHKHSGSASGAVLEVTVKKEDMTFPTTKVKVDPDTPILPTIVANAFSVCGNVEISEKLSPSFTPELLAMEISPEGKSQNAQKAYLNKDARFCFMKSPGEYNLRAKIPKVIEEQGLVIHPAIAKVSFTNSPVKGILFKQFQASFTVHVTCIAACKNVVVELSSAQVTRKKQKVSITEKVNDTIVKFDGVAPGEYTLHVSHNDWCWESESKKVTVPKELVKDTVPLAHFKQSGFVLVCSISHDIKMVIHHAGEPVDTFSLKKGRNRLCLSNLGKYTLEPQSCHKFDVQSPIVFDTANPKPINLHAIAHEAVITMEAKKLYLESPLKEDKIQVEIRSSRGKVTKDYLTLSEESIDGKKDTILYKLSYWASDGEKLDITPVSKLLLFDPPTAAASMQSGSCAVELVRFKGIVGTFVTGQINPPLSGVAVSISTVGSEVEPISLKTGKDGKYKVGPLHPQTEYAISASLDDYVLTPVPDKRGDFLAKKLSKLIFKINLGTDETPLPGVLLSISGGDYRSNNLTGKDGSLTLTKLEPGQYYFKAIMKEYQFSPPSQVIDIVEGAKTDINIVGKRVAFSVYGKVTSLNGEPETGTVVRALSQSGENNCAGLGEEGTSGNDGSFRIRGLHPGCEYNVSVYDGAERFSRIAPQHVTIIMKEEDVDNVKFVAFRSVVGFELSGYVITPQQFLPHIKLVLYRAGGGASANPVQTLSMTKATPFFHLPQLPRDETEYVVRLESTLSQSRYDYTAPAAGFFAKGSYKHITFRFEPQLKPVLPEIPQVSILALPLTILAIYLAYNYAAVFTFLQQTYQTMLAGMDPVRAPTQKSLRKSKK